MASSSNAGPDGELGMKEAIRTRRSPSYSPKLSSTSVKRVGSIGSSMSRSRSRSRSIDESQGYDDRHSPLPDHDNRYARRRRRSSERTSAAVEIKGLTEMVFEQHVDQIFCQYGRIEHLSIPRWRSDHEACGVAYVVYQSSSQAAEAIRHMDEGQIDGAIIRVRSIDEDSSVLRTAKHDRRNRPNDHPKSHLDDRRRRERSSRYHSRKRSRSPQYDHH